MGSLGQHQAIDETKKYLKGDSLFFLPIKKTDQTNKFLPHKKGMLLKEECDIFRGLRAIVGIVGLVPLCYCVFAVISRALNFSCGYFVGLRFFLVGLSWLGFPDCNIFRCWLKK